MRHVFWLVPDAIGGRAGPVLEPWVAPDLRTAGFGAVLNLSEHAPDTAALAEAGLACHWAPLPNAVPPSPETEAGCTRVLPEALQYLQDRIAAGHRVLVHCHAGQDRTGLLMALYMAQDHGLAAVEAIERVRTVRPGALTAPGWEVMAARIIPMILAEAGLPPLTDDYLARMPRIMEATELVSVGPDAAGRDARLAPGAAAAWQRLREAANQAGVPLVLHSAFRSVARQRKLVLRKHAAGQPWEQIWAVNARPGHSEHHAGWAIDLGAPGSQPLDEAFASTPQYHWLEQNAGDFGFVLTYPRDNRTGIAFEPWHWCWCPDHRSAPAT